MNFIYLSQLFSNTKYRIEKIKKYHYKIFKKIQNAKNVKRKREKEKERNTAGLSDVARYCLLHNCCEVYSI